MRAARPETSYPHRKYGGVNLRRAQGLHNATPMILFAWAKNGRRVYRLDQDAQLQAEMITFDRISWEEVPLPLKAFAIRLDMPIEVAGRRYHTIMYARERTADGQLVVVITAISDHMQCFTDGFYDLAIGMESGRTKLRRGRRAFDRLKRKHSMMGNSDSPLWFLQPSQLRGSIEDVIRNALEGYGRNPQTAVLNPVFERAMRNIAALPLFLHGQRRVRSSEARPPWSGPIPGASMLGAEVCEVRPPRPLDSDLRDSLLGMRRGDQASVAMSTHVRRMHPRWIKSQGAYTIVRATIVRRDRLAPGQAFPGAEHVIKGDP